MGLLDDLRREADLAREARETEAARQAELQNIYRSEMAPRLAGIYRYLTEMIEHLETANWMVEAAYDIPGVGRVENLRQGDYRLYIDSHESPRKITLQFARGAKEERKFSLQAAQAEEFRQFLVGHHSVFSEWPLRDSRGQINGATFQAKLRVKAGMLFEADIPSSRIRVVSHNVEDLERREYLFGYAAVDDSWLDELGHYLLRKKDVLGSRRLSEAARERLRQLAAEQARVEQRPSPPAVTVPDQEEREAGKAGLLRALRNRLFGTDK